MIPILVLEFDPVTGQLIPVPPEDLIDETAGFTSPPEGLTEKMLRRWQKEFHRLRRKGVAQEAAWVKATKHTIRT